LGSALVAQGSFWWLSLASLEPGTLAGRPSAHEGSKGRLSPLLRVALEPHSTVLPSIFGRQVYPNDTGSVNLDPSGKI
jgi:hypothetical protein